MKVAIMGYGTIGSGVAEVLKVNRDLIKRKTGKTLEVKYILDLREFPGTRTRGRSSTIFPSSTRMTRWSWWWRPWAASIRPTRL